MRRNAKWRYVSALAVVIDSSLKQNTRLAAFRCRVAAAEVRGTLLYLSPSSRKIDDD